MHRICWICNGTCNGQYIGNIVGDVMRRMYWKCVTETCSGRYIQNIVECIVGKCIGDLIRLVVDNIYRM